MAADRRLWKLKRADQIRHAEFAPFEQTKQTKPRRIPQGPKRAHERVQRLTDRIHSLSRMEGYIKGSSGASAETQPRAMRTRLWSTLHICRPFKSSLKKGS